MDIHNRSEMDSSDGGGVKSFGKIQLAPDKRKPVGVYLMLRAIESVEKRY